MCRYRHLTHTSRAKLEQTRGRLMAVGGIMRLVFKFVEFGSGIMKVNYCKIFQHISKVFKCNCYQDNRRVDI